MLNQYIKLLIPTQYEALVMSICGTIGGLISWALGDVNVSIQWLFCFVVVDYVTGMIAAFKTGQWSSDNGFKGIFKKAFIFLIVALGHGLDVTCHVDFIRCAIITAYSVNEVLSIVENIGRMGYAHVIPPVLRNMLKQLKEKESEVK